MNIAELLKTSLPDTTRRIQKLLEVLLKDISSDGRDSQFKNASRQCLRQRLMDARNDAAFLVFCLGTCNRDNDTSTSGMIVIADEHNLSLTVDDIESDWQRSSIAESNDMIDAEMSCPDEPPGGSGRVNGYTALGVNATPSPMPAGSTTTRSSSASLELGSLRRPEDLEILILALEGKLRAMEEEKRELQEQINQTALRKPPIVKRNDRSLAMANVKYLREKLQRRVASLGTFKVDSASIHQEVMQLRKKEKRLTDEVFHQRVELCKCKALNQMLERQLEALLCERHGSIRGTHFCETGSDDQSTLSPVFSRQHQEVLTSPHGREGPTTKLELLRETNIPLMQRNFAEKETMYCHLNQSNESVQSPDPQYSEKEDVLPLKDARQWLVCDLSMPGSREEGQQFNSLDDKTSHQIHLHNSSNKGLMCGTECVINELSFSKCSQSQ